MKLLRWCKANAMPVIAVLAAAVTAVSSVRRQAVREEWDGSTVWLPNTDAVCREQLT